jgi:hypothetical protein
MENKRYIKIKLADGIYLLVDNSIIKKQISYELKSKSPQQVKKKSQNKEKKNTKVKYFEVKMFDSKEDAEKFAKEYQNYIDKNSLYGFYSEDDKKYILIWRMTINKYWNKIKNVLEQNKEGVPLNEICKKTKLDKDLVLSILRFKQLVSEPEVIEPRPGVFRLI